MRRDTLVVVARRLAWWGWSMTLRPAGPSAVADSVCSRSALGMRRTCRRECASGGGEASTRGARRDRKRATSPLQQLRAMVSVPVRRGSPVHEQKFAVVRALNGFQNPFYMVIYFFHGSCSCNFCTAYPRRLLSRLGIPFRISIQSTIVPVRKSVWK